MIIATLLYCLLTINSTTLIQITISLLQISPTEIASTTLYMSMYHKYRLYIGLCVHRQLVLSHSSMCCLLIHWPVIIVVITVTILCYVHNELLCFTVCDIRLVCYCLLRYV